MLALISAAIEDPSDLEFMTQFYLQYERLMYATVMKRLSDPETAKDIVQDCVVKLIPKIPFLRQQKRCINASYVVSTVRNTTINYMRKHGRTDGRCCSLEGQDEQDMVPVVRVQDYQVWRTQLSAAGADLKLGSKVTLDADGLRVTATTESGVASIVALEGTAEGESVRVRFG